MAIRPATVEWLKKIPPGEYTLMQLVLMTKRDKSTISRLFKILKVAKRPGEFKHNNMVEIIYMWKGID